MDKLNFTSLPLEMQLEVLFNTEPQDIISLCCTSRQYSNICTDEYDYLWKYIVYNLINPIYDYNNIQEFNETNYTDFNTWCELYSYIYELPVNDDILLDEVRNGSVEMVKYLLDNGVNIKSVIDEALKISSANGYLELTEYLTERGANINSILRYSAENGHLDIVKYAVTHGANIHIYGDLPLLLASKNGHLNVIKYLVRHGANIHVYNNLALTYASNNGHQDIVNYLTKKSKLFI